MEEQQKMEKATVHAYSVLRFFSQKWRRPFKLVCTYRKTEIIFKILITVNCM